MVLNIQVPEVNNLKPTITVIGCGGAGGNAVNNMIESGVEGVKFVVANTDSQSLEASICENKIQLGIGVTQGLGAGSYPEVGKASAEESLDEIQDVLQGSNMVFVTAGMGGGTGTGAAPVMAQLAREQGILTVGVVTKPFHFEGTHRMRIAELGLQELQKYVDTMIVIPNQNLFRVADKNTTFLDAFKLADGVLKSGVKGITDLMIMPGLINLDFSDVRSVMSEMGKAMMGTGEAEGESRAVQAAEAAIANPLLDNVSMQGAKGVLINITGGSDMTLFEVDEAANRIREEVDENANIIFGSTFDMTLDGKMRVSVVATGIDTMPGQSPTKPSPRSNSFHESEIDSNDDFEDDGDDEFPTKNSFMAKAPVEPEQEPEFNNEEASEVKIANSQRPIAKDEFNRPGRPVQKPASATTASGGGIFGGLFNKKDSAEDEESSDSGNKITPASADSPTVSSGKKQNYEEELDVPAFLRRKKG